MFKWLSLLLLITVASSAKPVVEREDDPDYYRTKAMAGDGVYSLLRRYQLDGFSCNFDQFYKLNSLRPNAPLFAGRTYTLPILVYEFNGKTIRSSIGNNDWNVAVSIQHYNEAMHEAGQRDKDFRKDKVLWVPHHLLHCPKATLNIPAPAVSDPELSSGKAANGQRRFDIFGSNYAYTPLISTQLRGHVFYISSGHGGPDPGAIGQRGNYRLCEDEYAYDVSLRLCRNLVSHGATAYMIIRDPNDGIRDEKFLKCDADEVVWGNIRQSRHQKTRLFQRSDAINELYEKHRLQGVKSQRAIMVHVDSRSHSERTDLFFYHHPGSEEGKELSRQLHRTMRLKYKQYRAGGQYHGTVTGRDLHMLRECKPVSVYIELANIRNVFDQQRIILKSNRQYLADWLLEGLLDDK